MQTASSHIISTNQAVWHRAKKTAGLRAKHMAVPSGDRRMASKLLIDTLEGAEPMDTAALFCIGDAGDSWQQPSQALLRKYDIVSFDEDGWMNCVPKSGNEVEFFESVEAGFVRGLYGATVAGIPNLQSCNVGDFICRQPHNSEDQWVVRREFFKTTYKVDFEVGLIWAQAKNGVIGAGGGGGMPWHLPEDLAHFRRTTQGCPVLMGRKTWNSLPERHRPLPNRLNIVISRSPESLELPPGVIAASDIADGIGMAQRAMMDGTAPFSRQLWVIGGGEIYAAAMDEADRIVVTEIDLEVDGDTFAPPIDSALWKQSSRISSESSTGLRFDVAAWLRIRG